MPIAKEGKCPDRSLPIFQVWLCVLLDFCQLQKVEQGVFGVLMGIANLNNAKLYSVVALSSGQGHDLDCKIDYRTPIRQL